ncbi:hypothetical protein Q31b_43090 [Novipirellula aureliae]|uniref:N-terminal domain-containing protein n=1 Tax=Novipirellula aureliae TaxID=2527966 RepID=A0A5C6DPE9_9BACT|nr:ArdC family protein [Novipirellula aureliae]TWU37521.1 hypothetical protein Q31b_43090 [Novipirellula aureliae]
MNKQDAMNTVTNSLDDLYQALRAGRYEVMDKQLEVTARFHRYSFNNVMLIYKQCPEATLVAGFHTWKKQGRWVRSGESGIAILAPLTKRKEDDNEREEDSLVMGFRIVYVFDVSQTDGDALMEEAPILGDPGRNLSALLNVYRDLEIKVHLTKLPGTVQGYSLGGEVRVSDDLDDISLFRVLSHELAHELMHKTIRCTSENKPLLETEAEAVAFVVASACGVRCLDRSADYIALHEGSQILLENSLEAIHKTSSSILGMIEKQVVNFDNGIAQAA